MKKIKLLILLILPLFVLAQTPVPDTNTFSLQDVKTSVESHCSCTVNDLVSAFSNSEDSYFDPAYKGSKDRLTNFRNYTPLPPQWSPTVYYSSATSTSNISTSITTGIGQNLTILSIVTKNATRTGGIPTYNGNDMGVLITSQDVEMYYVDEVIDGTENIYIPNSSSDTIMYSVSSYKYYGNLYRTGSAYSNTTSTGSRFYLAIATSPSHYNLIVSTSYAYSNSQSISSASMSSAPTTLTTTASASECQRTKTGANINYSGSGSYSSSTTCTIADYIAIGSCSFYVY